MPKGQITKTRGAICNVSIDKIDISNTLPRQADTNGFVIVKLKRKHECRGHVYFESVRPYVINQLLQYLKLSDEFYLDIEIDICHIRNSVIEMINLNHEIPVEVDRLDQAPDLSFETDNDFFKEVHSTRAEREKILWMSIVLPRINLFWLIILILGMNLQL